MSDGYNFFVFNLFLQRQHQIKVPQGFVRMVTKQGQQPLRHAQVDEVRD